VHSIIYIVGLVVVVLAVQLFRIAPLAFSFWPERQANTGSSVPQPRETDDDDLHTSFFGLWDSGKT